MRSRYTALCAATRRICGHLARQHAAGFARARWRREMLGLDVKQHTPLDGAHAEVEFVARSRVQGRGQRLHERSRFVREDGHWLYVDGDLL